MSHIELNRRQFLISAGGYILSIPFLSSLSSVANAQTAGIPSRFISIRTIYGQVPQLFYPERPTQRIADNVYYQAIAPGQVISPILGEPFRGISHKLSILRGIDHTQKGHNTTTMLCPGTFDGYQGSTWPNSFDEVLSRSTLIYPNTPRLRSLKMEPSVSRYSPTFPYSYWNGERLQYERFMSPLFDKLFGNLNQSQTPVNQNRKVKVIDLAKSAFDKLKNSRQISSLDKNRLTQYGDILSDLENRARLNSPITCSSAPPSINGSGSFENAYEAAIEMSLLALACGMTNVISIAANHFGALDGESGSAFHGNSHWTYSSTDRMPDTGNGPERKMSYSLAPESTYLRQYSWTANKVAKLMTRMDAITESNGMTMLDNSLVYWGNEQSGGGHSANSMPTIFAGTLGGKIQPGSWDYTRRPFLYFAGQSQGSPPAGTLTQAALLTSLANMYGLPPSSYERNGIGGFGEFDLSTIKYNYLPDGGPSSQTQVAAEMYIGYTATNTDRRKSIFGWVKAA